MLSFVVMSEMGLRSGFKKKHTLKVRLIEYLQDRCVIWRMSTRLALVKNATTEKPNQLLVQSRKL